MGRNALAKSWDDMAHPPVVADVVSTLRFSFRFDAHQVISDLMLGAQGTRFPG